MKGLILKDLYMAVKYLRSYFLLIGVFLAVSWANGDSAFFMVYPCMLGGMIPVTLMAYDERSKWEVYAGTLPCTRAQLVSAKYIIGLMAQGTILVLSALVQGLRMVFTDGFSWDAYLTLMGMLLCLSCISGAITPPFMFRNGVEKGRMAYYVTIGVLCGGSVVLSSLFRGGVLAEFSLNGSLPVLCLVCVGLYALSWWLSIRFYEKREL